MSKKMKRKFYIKDVLSDFRGYKTNEICVITENEYIREIHPYVGIVMEYCIHGHYACL